MNCSHPAQRVLTEKIVSPQSKVGSSGLDQFPDAARHFRNRAGSESNTGSDTASSCMCLESWPDSDHFFAVARLPETVLLDSRDDNRAERRSAIFVLSTQAPVALRLEKQPAGYGGH